MHPPFSIEGHRGARGLVAENTLPSFVAALEIGVHGFELDLGLTADDEVVVAHDRYLSPYLHRNANRQYLDRDDLALRWLSLAELQQFDAGRVHPNSSCAKRFPEQRPADGARIPTLAEVVALVTRYQGEALHFSLELKYSPLDTESTVPPDVFAKRVVREVRALGITERVTILCFYWPMVREVRCLAPDMATACLSCEMPTQNTVRPPKHERDGKWTAVFGKEAVLSPWTQMSANDYASTPDMVAACGATQWSPFYLDLNRDLVAHAQSLGLRVVPWTVNKAKDMHRLITLGVDGIITDYPNRLRDVASECGLPLPPPLVAPHTPA